MQYYRRTYSYPGFGTGFRMTSAVKWLILINVIVFLAVSIFSGFPWFTLFGMVPTLVTGKLMLWQLVTYMFLHGGLMHLFFNMWILFMFGTAVEKYWGRKQFLTYYFFTGIGAGICSLVTSLNSSIPVVGASGAIFGLLVAYAMLFPDSIILVFFILPMKARHAVLLFAAIDLMGALSNPGTGIAYFAHLGGALFGYLYLKNEWIRLRLYRFAGFNIKGWFKKTQQSRRKKTIKRKKKQQDDLDSRVDEILDKINRYGIGSITTEERQILERKRRQTK